MSIAAGDETGQRGPPEPSFDLIRKLWRVGSMFFFGDRKAKARFLLFIVLLLCAVCAGSSLPSPSLRLAAWLMSFANPLGVLGQVGLPLGKLFPLLLQCSSWHRL